jgi:hypothetical protein
MSAMLDMNPGMRDQVQFYIDFPDYSENELLQIFETLCKDNKYKLSADARNTRVDGFARIVKSKSPNFSNGRLVRKLFERVRMKQALRSSGNNIAGADIEAVFAEPDITVMLTGKNTVRLGFGA